MRVQLLTKERCLTLLVAAYGAQNIIANTMQHGQLNLTAKPGEHS